MDDAISVKKPAVIPAKAGIQVVHLLDFQSNQPYELDSRLRGNDGYFRHRHCFTTSQTATTKSP
jgi:hypothetical protein